MLTKDQALQRCMSACMQHAAEWQQGEYEAYRESVVQNLDAVIQLHVLTNSLVQRLHYVWRTPKELWRVQHRTQQIYCRSLDENLAHKEQCHQQGTFSQIALLFARPLFSGCKSAAIQGFRARLPCLMLEDLMLTFPISWAIAFLDMLTFPAQRGASLPQSLDTDVP